MYGVCWLVEVINFPNPKFYFHLKQHCNKKIPSIFRWFHGWDFGILQPDRLPLVLLYLLVESKRFAKQVFDDFRAFCSSISCFTDVFMEVVELCFWEEPVLMLEQGRTHQIPERLWLIWVVRNGQDELPSSVPHSLELGAEVVAEETVTQARFLAVADQAADVRAVNDPVIWHACHLPTSTLCVHVTVQGYLPNNVVYHPQFDLGCLVTGHYLK